MKKLLFVSLLCLFFSGCDQDEPDPFIGGWVYKSAQITIEFQITKAQSGYHITDIKTNGDTWSASVPEDVVIGKKIGRFSLFKNINGVGFLGCKPFGGSIAVDTVLYQEGTNRTLFFNQKIDHKEVK